MRFCLLWLPPAVATLHSLRFAVHRGSEGFGDLDVYLPKYQIAAI